MPINPLHDFDGSLTQSAPGPHAAEDRKLRDQFLALSKGFENDADLLNGQRLMNWTLCLPACSSGETNYENLRYRCV
jgi:hypothetical protein